MQVLSMLKMNGYKILSFALAVCVMFTFCSCSNKNTDFDGKRFGKTRSITVLVDSLYDSGFDSDVAEYIHSRVLEDCNIDVSFMDSSKMNLYRGLSADLDFTTNTNMLISFYRYGSVLNLAPYLDQYSSSLTDLESYLGDENIYNSNSNPNEIIWLNARSDRPVSKVTFIRSDWLDKLGLDVPQTTDEFYSCLKAFQQNADLLLDDRSDSMIPFLIDSEPNISAKPLFDSFLDTSISDREFYDYGYCRAAQPGYYLGLEQLNSWYLEGLIPEDFNNIGVNTKEYYGPIEDGLVGAFCADYDYLYINGDDAHIKAFKENCGEEAEYIPVNTFADANGEYNCWQEDYIHDGVNKVFLPATCRDPLACMIYLNWISNTDNIKAIKDLNPDDKCACDKFLITSQSSDVTGIYDVSSYDLAKQIAMENTYIHRGSICIRYWPEICNSFDSERDYSVSYPESIPVYVDNVIRAENGSFNEVLSDEYSHFLDRGVKLLFLIRDEEWDKVMVKGDMLPD